MALLLCAVLGGMIGGCGSSASEAPSMILITVDTLRADRLNPYGYEKIATPAINRLASEGILFEQAFADVSWTVPSIASVMTGKYPVEHGVRTWHDRLGEEHMTLAELLEERNYSTAAIVGSYPLDRGFGFSQGFHHYDDEMNAPLVAGQEGPLPKPEWFDGSVREKNLWQRAREGNDAYRSDDQVADRAIAWLNENAESRFFLWVHFFGPHEKVKSRHRLPPGERKAHIQKQIARYDPDVEFMDRQVGRLLERLRSDPRTEDAVILFHSDHGQSLNEHGLFGHGADLYDTCAHVPLIVRLPRAERAGERVPHLVRNLDIFPTVLRLAGIPVPAATAGRDLLAPGASSHDHVYLETYHSLGVWDRDVEVQGQTLRVATVSMGLRTRDWKLITYQPAAASTENKIGSLPEAFVAERRQTQLFHLPGDADEKRNLARDQPDRVRQMLATVESYADRAASAPRQGRRLDESAKERLRALGYLE